MESQRAMLDPAEFCKKWWELGWRLFVMDPAHIEGINDWRFCELANERSFMKHWIGNIVPCSGDCPVLTIHRTMNRSAPYDDGAEWAERLPHGRLLTVEGIGHVPWVEAPAVAWPAIESFLFSEAV